MSGYVGRFAPSPTGPLHAGLLVAAIASYLDAKAHGGRWLVRIEDLDLPRTVDGADDQILQCLQHLGMQWDGEVVWQNRRGALYEAAFEKLRDHVYACGCTRREIGDSRIGIGSDGAAVYPGTCRGGLASGRLARAFRLRVPELSESMECVEFDDRMAGRVAQHLATATGDFVLKRADGFWAYQLAVVVDDADQCVTDVVRGADLIDSTPRQIYLQTLLGLPTPRYLHLPVVVNEAGEKLSKQTGARAIDLEHPVEELQVAAAFLGLAIERAESIAEFWPRAIDAWGRRWRKT
jgi:glutamyl-Q tRNA(Asp) synthetase